eukprot:SAG31_NODE_676_length_12896_cov_10.122060_7_plen_429_part_00
MDAGKKGAASPRHHDLLNEPSKTSTWPPIALVPGIMGSNMVDKRHASIRHYLRFGQIFNMGRRSDLSLPWWPMDRPSQPRDNIIASGPLRHVGPAICGRCGGLAIDVYGGFLDWACLVSGSKSRVHAFGYDWRRSNNESAEQLESFLTDVRAFHGEPPLVVAHSNGGLIAMAVLNDRPELFHSVLFAGVPFGVGGPFLNDMHNVGKQRYGLNADLLHPDVLATHSCYAAFFASAESIARPGCGRQVGAVRGPQGERLDLLDVSVWQRYRLGPWRPGGPVAAGTVDGAVVATHFKMAMADAQAFRRRLVPRTETDAIGSGFRYPPIAVLNASHTPTPRDGSVPHLGVVDFENRSAPNVQMAPGDGRIPAEMTLPPEAVPLVSVEQTTHGHRRLLADKKIVLKVLHTLVFAADVAALDGRGQGLCCAARP